VVGTGRPHVHTISGAPGGLALPQLSSNSLRPCSGVGTYWATEAFQDKFAEFFEQETFADA